MHYVDVNNCDIGRTARKCRGISQCYESDYHEFKCNTVNFSI